MDHDYTWVEATTSIVILLIMVALVIFRLDKLIAAFIVVAAVVFAIEGEWPTAVVYAVLAAIWFVSPKLKNWLVRRDEAKQRREDESVANSAGEPDNLPY